MENVYLVLNVATLLVFAVFAPMIYSQIKGAKMYTELLDMDKLKAYIKILDEKGTAENELIIGKHQRINIDNLRKISKFKEKLHHDYQNILFEVMTMLRELEIEDKAAYIDSHFPSHKQFLKYTVLGLEE